MFIACFRREMITLETRMNLMAKTKYAKAQKLPKREYDKVQALKDDYLQTVYRKKQVLSTWKTWERLRWVAGLFAWLALAACSLFGAYKWYKATDTSAGNYFIREILGHEFSIYRTTAKFILLGVALFALFGIIYLILGAVCKKKYRAYATKADHVDIKLDNLKREKIDAVLENQIVVSVRSIFETLLDYEEVLDDEDEDDDDYEYLDVDEDSPAEVRVINGAVDNAVVYIDGMEVGAVDLDSEFSCFRVEPGLHSLKIVIRKEFPFYNKQLVLETPINPIRVDGDYRIVLYTLLTKQHKGIIRYKLKASEYDDMVIFMRDTRQAGNLDATFNADRLSKRLIKRAKKLHVKIFGIPETEEQMRIRETGLYGQETVHMEALSKNMPSTYHDARFSKTNKIEITLSEQLQNLLTKR